MSKSKSKYTKLSLALLLAFIPLLGVATMAYAAPTAIEVAQSSLSAAQAELIAAQDNKVSTSNALAVADSALAAANAAVVSAQSDYDTKRITVTTSNSSGLSVDIYNNTISRTPNSANLCRHDTVSQINADWGGGSIMGCNADRVTVHYYGTLTVPASGQYRFTNIADDGFFMTLDGQVTINDWRDKGCGGNAYYTQLQAGHAYVLDAWFYENGGGACSTLYSQGPTFGYGIVPVSWFGSTPVTSVIADPALLVVLNVAKSVQVAAQASYDLALVNDAAADNRLAAAVAAVPIAEAALAQAQYDAIIPSSAPVITSYTQQDSAITIYPSLPNNEIANTWFYRVVASDAACSNPYANQTLNTDGAPSSFTISNLTNDCQYQVAVANWNGKSSEYTQILVAPAAPLVLNSPTNLQVTISGNSAHLTWDAPAQSNAAVERYAVMWSYDNFQSGFGLPSNSTEATVTGLTWGSSLSFVVRADNDSRQVYSSYSSAVSVAVGEEPVPVVVVTPTPTPTPEIMVTPVVVPSVEPTPDPTPVPVEAIPAPTSIYPQDAVFLTADEGAGIRYTAPAGFVVSSVLFASYGTPNNFAVGECDAIGSVSIVAAATTSTDVVIDANNSNFGDPCGGTYKKLEVVLVIAVDPNYVAPTSEPTQGPISTPVPSTSSDPVPLPEPSQQPVSEPSPEPSQSATLDPVVVPTPEPSTLPLPVPEPTKDPVLPTPEPSISVLTPEPSPVVVPTTDPTIAPIVMPTPQLVVKEVIKAQDLPTVISVAQLQDIKLDQIVATDLTPEQAGALKEAALQTFDTAVAGSPEYTQALDALLVAAKADDIVLDPALAGVPGAAALVDAINLLSNVGADISPVVRGQAQKATVAAVIVGQIAGAASIATSGSSSSSSSSRKNNINRKAK